MFFFKFRKRASHQGWPQRRSSGPRRQRLFLEQLEERTLPSVVNWMGGSGDFGDPTHWSTGSVPGPGDDAMIDTGSVVTVTVGAGDGESVNSLKTGANTTLQISGGTLSVAATSTLAGPLSVSDGTLTATGSGTVLRANGATTVSGGGVFAESAATFDLPELTASVNNGPSGIVTLEADGSTSVLDLPALTSLGTLGGGYYINASTGGQVDVPALSTINSGSPNLAIDYITSDGSGSQIDLSGLTSMAGASLQVTNSGTVLDPHLTSLTAGAEVDFDGTGTLATSQWTTFENSGLRVTGGSYVFSGLDVDGSNLFADGGSLSLPDLTSYSYTTGGLSGFAASGSGGVLNLPKLTTVNLAQMGWSLQASSGGQVSLPVLTTVSGPISIIADGTGSQIDVSALTTLNSAGDSIQATNGGTILDSKLTTLNGVQVVLDGSGTIATAGWSVDNGEIEILGGSTTLSGLNIDGSTIFVSNGSLTLDGMMSYANTTGTMTSFEATGPNSSLTLANLTSLTVDSASTVQIEAQGGGTVTLSAMQTIDTGNVILESDGSGSMLNLPELTTFTGSATTNSTLQVTNSGTIADGSLASLSNVNIVLDGTGTMDVNQITSLFGSISLAAPAGPSATPGSLTLSGLTSVANATVVVGGGGTLNLPAATVYTGTTVLQAFDDGSTLTLANTSLSEATTAGSVLVIQALAGGQGGASVSFPALTSVSGGLVVLDSNGAGAVISLPALQTFTSSGGASASNGGSIQSPITLPAAPNVWVNSGGGDWGNDSNWALGAPAVGENVIINTAAATTVTLEGGASINSLTLGANDGLTISDGTLTVAGNVSNSGSLSFDNFSRLTVGGNEAEGSSATINEQIAGTPKSGIFGLLAVTGTATLAGTYNVALVNGFNPSVGQDFPVITFAHVSGSFTTVNVPGGVLTDTLNTTSFDLIDHPAAPTLTAYSPPTAAVGSAYSYKFQAIGSSPITFSATGLPGWATLDPSTGILSGIPPAVGTFSFTVTASNSVAPNATKSVSLTAQLEPPTFVNDTPPDAVAGSPYSYTFQATGTGTMPISYSATNLPSWAQLNPTTGVLSGTPPADDIFDFTVTASNGITPDTTEDVTLNVIGQTGAVFNIATGTTVTIPSTTYAGGTTFNVGAGATVTIPGGTFTGGVTFNVDAGAIVDLTGDGTPSYSGTLTGSGAGTVQLSSGRLFIGTGGLTLNFAGSMFQWIGGQMDAGNGDLTNLGTMSITGDAEKDFYNDGVLDNFGTIIQTGTGKLQLGTDGTFPTTLKNEAGASYLLEGDAQLTEISDSGSAPGQTSLDNEGVIRKTGGTGTLLFKVLGSITNTGTIEADSGTIVFNPVLGISQIVNGSLTGGTWNALDGAALQFPTGTIASNAGTLALGGAGATITGINLSANSGSLTVTGGASFATAANFTNSGSLTVGVGSTLTVSGNLTETVGGTLNAQIGGTSQSGQFGQVAVSGTATLGGTFMVTPVNSFSGVANQDFKVMTFASASGAFSAVLGLGSVFSEAINPTSFDLYAFRNPADLQVSNVSAPQTVTSGQQIPITWQVADQGPSNAAGSWQDSVYLSATPAITSNSILLGTVPHSGGLNANSSYNGMLAATVPAVAPGSYYVLVQGDSLYQVSDPNRANNTAVAANQVNISLPALSLGKAFNDSFTAADQDHYYQVMVPAGGTLSIALASTAASGATGLYVSQGQLPTPFSSQYSAVVANQPNQLVLVPQVPVATTYYILAHSISGNAATAAFTITAAQNGALSITSIPSTPSGNGGNATVTIDGTNFAPNITASLTLGNTTINALSVQFVNASQIVAVFNLTGVAAGNYSLQVQQGNQPATAPTSFAVAAASTGNPLQLDLTTPDLVRAGRGGIDYVTVTNISNNDVPAPLLVLSSDAANMYLPSDPNFQSSALTFLAISPTGQPGTLTAGETVTIPIDFLSTTTNPTIDFALSQTDTTQPFDYSELSSGLAQFASDVPNAAVALTFLENEVGSTWGDYVAMLDRNANLVPPQMGSPNDPKILFNIEFNKALAAVNTSLSGALQTIDPGVTLGGQTIKAVDTTSGATLTTTSLNDGSFVFSTLPASTYTLSVTGLVVTSNPVVTVSAGQSLTGVDLTVSQGAQITGQVSQTPSTPIAGATVQATNEANQQVFNVTADANGNYSLTGLPAGKYDLFVTATGYASAAIVGVDVTQGNATENITLSSQSSLTGTISLLSGGPRETTLVVKAVNTATNQSYSTTTTSTAFALDGMSAGTYSVSLSLPGYVSQTLSNVVVGPGQSLNLGTITLAPTSEIDGKVTSTDPNNPAGHLAVEAMAGGTVVGGTITDGAGNFQIINLPPGTYTLVVPSAAIVTAPTVTVTLGQDVTAQAITVQPGGKITGTVTSPSSAPLAGMSVFLAGPAGLSEATTTDANGNYQFTGLNTGSYQVYLLIGGSNSSQTVTVTMVNGTVVTANLQLAYVATITGTLTDGSGNPITGGDVTLYQSSNAIADAQTNASGVYTFLILQPGTFDLAASASEGTFPLATGLVVNLGDAVTQDFQTGGGTLNITVSDGSQAVAGDTVELDDMVDGYAAVVGQTTVAADGTASFANLTANTYTVQVAATDNDAGQATVSVAASGTTSVNIALAAQSTISGTITDASAKPIAGATVVVQLSSDLQQTAEAITAADGTYALAGLAPGSYDITVFADGYLAATQTSIAISGTATFNTTLSNSNTTITGTLVDGAANPVPSGAVAVLDAAGHVLGAATVGPNGSFTVTSAAGDNLDLQVVAQGYAPQSVTINAPAGAGTQLNPVALQAVAIDPGTTGSGNEGSVGPLLAAPSDGQSYADQTMQKAQDIMGMTTNVTPPGKPSCPNCMGAYSSAVQAANLTNNAAKIVSGLVDQVNSDADALTAAAEGAVSAVHELEGSASIDGGVAADFAEQLPSQPATDYLRGFTRGLDTLDTSGFDEAAGDLRFAPTALAIQTVAGNASSSAHTLIQQIQAIAAAVSGAGLFILHPQGKKDLPADSAEAQIFHHLDFSVGALLQAAQQLLGPFQAAISAASVLGDDFQQLQTAYGAYQAHLADFKAASAALKQCEAQPCQPAPPQKSPSAKKSTPNKDDKDPNALIGPAGFGTQGFIQDGGTLPYTIEFENDGEVATQDVTVTQQLSPNLDWSTFRLGSFGFGPVNVTVPAGLTQYQTTVSYQNTDGSSLNVLVELNFNVQTGLLTGTFTSLDPVSGQAPAGVYDGFLYPDNSSHVGEGFVQYTVQPKASLSTGAAINQQAAVVFDINAALSTDTARNTIDAVAPTSHVNPLPARNSPGFTVSWTGQDDVGGSGVGSYDVYVSDNGGTWMLWQNRMALSAAVYAGQLGHSYAFYSVAFDNVGNEESKTPAVEAQTTTAEIQSAFNETEDTSTPAAVAISAVLGNHVTVEANHKPGIAVTGLTGNGTWQYELAGSGWVNITAVSGSNALLLPATASLRFVPAAHWNGTADLVYVAWDGSEGKAGGRGNTAVAGGGSAFSAAAGMVAVTVTPVNHAPTWTATVATLTADLPGATDPAGQTVQQAFGSRFRDVDANPVGIAISSAGGNGTWQYSSDGQHWTPLGSVSPGAALLLSAADFIRFLPAIGFTGKAALQVHAWDGTTATAGTAVNLTGKNAAGGATAFSTAVLSASLAVQPNHAPTWSAATATLTAPGNPNGYLVLPLEASDPPGVTVAAVFSSRFSDVDLNPAGVAVTAMSGVANGTWQYSADGQNWAPFGNVSTNAALLLPANDLIRFLPNAGVVGTVTLQVHAWDGTTGTAGGTANLSGKNATGASTAFSTAILSASGLVNTVNVAPVWTAKKLTLPAILPAITPAGVPIATLFGNVFSDPDGDPVGIAVTGDIVAAKQGHWQYSTDGVHWTNLDGASLSAAMPLSGADLLRFLPASTFTAANLQVAAWDGTPGQAGTALNLGGKNATGGTTAFSSTALTVSIAAAARGPSWKGAGAAFTPVLPAPSLSNGETVADVFGPYFRDAAPGAMVGIAVGGLTAAPAQGTWQYQLAGSTAWQDIGSVSATHALLLSADARIRFVPSAGFLGTVTLTTFAWDGSTGQAGTNARVNGLAYSRTALTAICLVNTAPTLSA